MRPGEKFAHWELRGVPLRVTVGAKDLGGGNVTVVRRVDGEESLVALDGLGARAQRMLDERSVDVATLAELVAAFADRPVFASAPFCSRPDCEAGIKAAVHAATVRILRADRSGDGRPCLVCEQPAESVALIARAY